MKKISVIIPVYNSEPYLQRLFSSLDSQVHKKCEYIFVNDGSTDNSENLILSYKNGKSNIIYLKQNNQGIAVARNTGLKQATGEYIAFVDSDDYILPTFFSTLINNIEMTGADIALTGVCVEKNGVITEREHESENIVKSHIDHIKDILLKINASYIVCNKLFKRNILKEFEFLVGYIFEDMYASNITAMKATKIAYISDDLYIYCVRENSVFTTVNDKQFTNFAYLANKIVNNYIKENYIKEIKNEILIYLKQSIERMESVFLRSKENDLVTTNAYNSSISILQELINKVNII